MSLEKRSKASSSMRGFSDAAHSETNLLKQNSSRLPLNMLKNIPFERVRWTNTAFLATINLTALVAAPLYIWKYGLDTFQIILFVVGFIATGMSITLGYHRLFAHLSFKAKWPVKFATLVFGACAFENSAINWVSDHRRHHKHVDHDDDPYDITKGFLWAHIGWILFKLRPEAPVDNVNDLWKDRMIVWQHKYSIPIAVIVGLLLPAALGYWHSGAVGALGGFIIGGVTRVFAVQHSTFFINSLCHTIGRQPYSTKCSARDSALMAFFTFGEGYHNYHHEFQHDYRNGVKAFTFDPTKWTIWLLAKLGLASDLRRVPAEKILMAEMTEARRLAELKLSAPHSAWEDAGQHAREMLDQLTQKVADAYHELEQAAAQKVEISRQRMAEWHRQTRELAGYVARLQVPLPA